MTNTDMIITYFQAGKPVISDRRALGHIEPEESDSLGQKLELISSNEKDGVIVLRRPLDSGGYVIGDESVSMIYAYTNTAVSSASLRQHDKYGRISSINLFSDSEVGESNVRVVHGVLMFLAWGLLAPAAIFIARHTKSALGIWWFRSHVGLFLVTLIFMIIAFSLILVDGGTVDGSVHGIFGVIVFSLALAQACLGVVIHFNYRPDRAQVPLIDKIHWWVGRSLLVAALVTMALGSTFFGVGILIAYLVYVAIIVALFVFAEFRYGGGHSRLHGNDSSLELSNK